MYIFCFYTAISKSPKHRPNFLKITDTSVTLIVFNDVFCDISAYTGTLFFLLLYMNLVQGILYKVHDQKTLKFI